MCRLLVDIACLMDVKERMEPVKMEEITSLLFVKSVWQRHRDAGRCETWDDLTMSMSSVCDYHNQFHEYLDWAERAICAQETAKFKERFGK
jgi:hypothetical protein